MKREGLNKQNKKDYETIKAVKKSFDVYYLLLHLEIDKAMGFKEKDEDGKKHKMHKVFEFYDEYTQSVEIIFKDEIIKVYFQTDPKTRLNLQ